MKDITQQNLLINKQQIKISEILKDIKEVGGFNAAKKLSKQTHLGIIDAKYVIDCIEKEAYHHLINIIEHDAVVKEKVVIEKKKNEIVVTYNIHGKTIIVTPDDHRWNHIKSLLTENNPLVEAYEKAFEKNRKKHSKSTNRLFIKKGNHRFLYVIISIFIAIVIYFLLMRS